MKATDEILDKHTRAICAHCECLAMNVGDMQAVAAGTTPPYTDAHYFQALQKWGLMNEKGEPI